MDALGFGPLIAWVRGVLADLLGPDLAWLALPLTYAAYGFGLAALLTATRRTWRRVTDRWMLVRRPLQRIWHDYGTRHPGHAFDLSRRLLRETNVHPLSPLAGLVQSTLWFFAARNALVPWQDASFRTTVGQAPPEFFGLDAGAGVSGLTAWVVFLIAALLAWFTSWSIFGQVRARLHRRAWLTQRFPAKGTTLVPLLCVAAYLGLLYRLTVWLPALPTVWATAILALLLIPAQAMARRQDRRRAPLDVRLPDWVWYGALPAPRAKPRTTVTRSPAREPAAVTASSGATAVEEFAEPERPKAPTLLLSGMVRRVTEATGRARVTEAPAARTPVAPTRVLPAEWASLAPVPTTLGPQEPRTLGPYSIIGRIGSGGMAIVYLASSRRHDRIALKVANPLTSVTDAGERLVAEITALARVADPAVVEIHDAGIIDDRPYLAMAYLRGPSLHEAVRALGPLTHRDALWALGEALAQGLAAIHRVGVHRDLKPANVILTDAGPVIVDLGIAKLRGVTLELTREGTTLGTIGYTGPEVLRAEKATPASDVFAWGACLAFAATGRPLFGGDTIAAQLDAVRTGRAEVTVLRDLEAVDPALAALVKRCTRPDPAARPADGNAVLRALPRGTRWPAPPGALA
ncbi:serine/threonine-protein kinase [Propionicicella superfundia]|uniref:serine/threonine-protein kinase n=1 Tax=Propionicicella superfundia TaxID=348582 RepID=UPI0004244F00|nr:serine/threonine-protein kinase [Propionicicella superfundia]